MKRLLQTVFAHYKYRLLIVLTVIAMFLLTFASQLEMFALGIITQKDTEPTAQAQQNLFLELIHQLNYLVPINENFLYLACFLVFVALFKATTLFTYRFSSKLIAIHISSDLRQQYFEHLQAMPMHFYQQYHIGSLSSRVVGDAALIADSISAILVNYLQTPFTIITTLSLCFLISWKLSLLIFLGFPLILYPIFFLAKHVKRISKQILQNQEKFATVLIDFLAGIQTVKVFAMEEFSLKKYREQNDHLATLEKKSARYDLSSRPVIHTIAMGFLATALLYGMYILNMGVGEVFFYCGLLYLFYEPFKKFAEENTHIQRGVAAAERMYEVLEIKPQIQDEQGAIELTQFEGPIEFDHVWFRYEEEWILKDLSFQVNKGETVAIVGPTGAGKSTIVQLLPRLYDIQKGEIRINGKSIKTYTQKSLRDCIAFVPQKPFLFLDTIAENISYGRKFTQEQIKIAAVKAHAHEFISCLSEGYQTKIAEMGKNLSGGQQQRIAIARALVKNAPILVMDEATSSLDTISEYQIKSAIHQLRGEITQIIIAHRLTTIEDADKIIYLEKGEKIAEGTKTELLQNCNGFRMMWEMMHQSSKKNLET